MRISDWSSDVCSSDLPRVELAQALLADADLLGHAGPEVLDVNVGFLDQRIELRQVRGLFGVKRDAALVAVVGLEMRAVQAVLERQERKIGRASCRERVCQYV